MSKIISKVIIGLEVHVELRTKSKMFCGCTADHFGKKPNTQTCPTCLGLPGALPVPNKKAIEWTILLGLAFKGEIQRKSRFDRKNYFYPDLPKGYQISQYDQPFILNGQIFLKDKKEVRIKRIHLEEDTGKLLHETVDGEKCTLVDYNRSGVALVEIVSEPDINSSAEAKQYLEKVQQMVRFLGISDADMEKGSMRCEPNVNLEIKEGEKVFYTPIVELKNINSFRFAQKAIDFEIKRQFEEFLEDGVEKSKGNKQTRGWDEKKQITFLQRAKEEANDYRYFPEPDIPPFEWSRQEIENYELRIMNYELPDKIMARFMTDFELSEYQAEILTAEPKITSFYEKTVEMGKKRDVPPIEIANVIINKRSPEGLSPEELIKFIISSRKVEMSGGEKEKKINEVLAKNPAVVESYRSGKPQALGVIVGIVKKETGAIVTLDEIIKSIDGAKVSDLPPKVEIK